MPSPRLIIIGLVVVGVLVVKGGPLLLTVDHETEGETEGPTKALAAAIEANRPRAAPPGAAGYVRGVRAHFGPVSESRFLDAFGENYGSGRNRTSDVVSELFVRGKRGAGVLKLDFDQDRITGMSEVEPGDVHTDLSDEEQEAVERGFKRRGGETASLGILSG